jgi:hypothetical protein
MYDLIEEPWTMPKTGYWGPAKILETHPVERLVRVHVAGSECDHDVWARLAIAHHCELEPGQTALVVGQSSDDLYVIGLLSAGKTPAKKSSRVVLRNGVSATVVGSPDEEKLELRSKAGDLVIEYYSTTGKTRVNVGTGVLEFVAKDGNIDFSAGKDIRLTSRQGIEMRSVSSIRLVTSNTIGKLLCSLALSPGRMKVNSHEVVVEAQKSEVRVAESRWVGKQLTVTVARAKLVAGTLETLANDVMQNAKNIYTHVEGLAQTTTKRMRTIVSSTYHLKSQQTYMKAEEDFKVNADKIHLG